MPTATMPWWKSLAIMNENKGVFGLNMLQLVGPRGQPRPRRRAARRRTSPPGGSSRSSPRPSRSSEAADAHRFIDERRNVGKVVLRAVIVPAARRQLVGSFFDEHIVDAGKLPAFIYLIFFLGPSRSSGRART